MSILLHAVRKSRIEFPFFWCPVPMRLDGRWGGGKELPSFVWDAASGTKRASVLDWGWNERGRRGGEERKREGRSKREAEGDGVWDGDL